MRKLDGEQILMRIFIGESDRWEHRPLHAALLELFRSRGLAGATVLLYFAVRILRARPEPAERKKFAGPLWRGFASAYLLTLANPPTILFFAGLFASIAALSTFEQAAVFALGIFTGSILWWLALTSVVAGSAAKLAPNVLVWINRLAGLTLIGFAVYALSAVNLRALP